MNIVRLLRDTVARIVAIREAIACGDIDLADTIAYDLEVDLAGGLSSIGDDEPRVCLADFNTIPSR